MPEFLERYLSVAQSVLRTAVAASTSILVAQACGIANPIYGSIAALIVTEVSPSRTRGLFLRHIGSVLVGGACGVLVALFVEPVAWRVGMGVVAAMLVSELPFVRSSARLAAYTSAVIAFTDRGPIWTHVLPCLSNIFLGISFVWILSVVPRVLYLEDIMCRNRLHDNVVIITSRRPTTSIPTLLVHPRTSQK